MLIYSLMVSDIDEKTYEMAMLRALGLRTTSVVQMIFLQSLVFLIPGVIAGLAVSGIINVLIRYLCFSYTVSYTSYFLSTSALILGVVVGVSMPIVSNLLTVQKALGKKIRDSLDVFRTTANDVFVQIVKLQQFGISLFNLSLGLTLVAMGILTYYLAPASFLFDRLDIFFFIINLILICMILGLAFLCFLVFPYLQTALVYLVCGILRFDRKLRPLILKNMNQSHKKRNAKTSILFTVCLAYLIFGGSSLLLLGNLIIGTIKSLIGADMMITAIVPDKNLPEASLRAYFETDMGKPDPVVDSYSFRGRNMDSYLRKVQNYGSKFVINSGLANIEFRMEVDPVEENYLECSLTDYYIPTNEQKNIDFRKVNGKNDLVSSLFTDEGTETFYGGKDKYNVTSKNMTAPLPPEDFNATQQVKIILPEGIMKPLSVEGGETIQMKSIFYGKQRVWRTLIRGLPRKLPGFTYMSYPQIKNFIQGVISIDQAAVIMYEHFKTSPDLQITKDLKEYFECKGKRPFLPGNETQRCSTEFYQKDRALIKLKEGVTEEDREYLA